MCVTDRNDGKTQNDQPNDPLKEMVPARDS